LGIGLFGFLKQELKRHFQLNPFVIVNGCLYSYDGDSVVMVFSLTACRAKVVLIITRRCLRAEEDCFTYFARA
jgi:hypothetical protein